MLGNVSRPAFDFLPSPAISAQFFALLTSAYNELLGNISICDFPFFISFSNICYVFCSTVAKISFPIFYRSFTFLLYSELFCISLHDINGSVLISSAVLLDPVAFRAKFYSFRLFKGFFE